jgi:hypothetical protein
VTVLGLCAEYSNLFHAGIVLFGIADSRGTLLGIPISHKDLAGIVGASRPRITEHLAQMERDQMIIRQGRQFIINTDELSRSLVSRSPDARD